MKRGGQDNESHPSKKKCTQQESDWKDLLRKYTVRDLLAKRKKELVVIDKHTILGEAMTVRTHCSLKNLTVADPKEAKHIVFASSGRKGEEVPWFC
jgi:hypothetical protein